MPAFLFNNWLKPRYQSSFLLLLAYSFAFSGCSLFIPPPDNLNEDLLAPLPKRSNFALLPVADQGVDYERQEFFDGVFWGSPFQLLAIIEKSGDELVLAGNATAGQPIFVMNQKGKQLIAEDRYFDLKGLKFSWILADYQFIHFPLEKLNAQLVPKGYELVETKTDTGKTRQLFKNSDTSWPLFDVVYTGEAPAYETISFKHNVWQYSYTIQTLGFDVIDTEAAAQ